MRSDFGVGTRTFSFQVFFPRYSASNSVLHTNPHESLTRDNNNSSSSSNRNNIRSSGSHSNNPMSKQGGKGGAATGKAKKPAKPGADEKREDVLQAVILADSFQDRFRPFTLETPRVCRRLS